MDGNYVIDLKALPTNLEGNYTFDLRRMAPFVRLEIMKRQHPPFIKDITYNERMASELLVAYPHVDPLMRHILDMKKYRRDVWELRFMISEDPRPKYELPEIPEAPERRVNPLPDPGWMPTRETLRESAEQCVRIMLQAFGFTSVSYRSVRELAGRLSGLMEQLCETWKDFFDPDLPGAGFHYVLSEEGYKDGYQGLADHIHLLQRKQKDKMDKCKRLLTSAEFDADLKRLYAKQMTRRVDHSDTGSSSGRLTSMSTASESSAPDRSITLPREWFSDGNNTGASSPDFTHTMALDSGSSSEVLNIEPTTTSDSSGQDAKPPPEQPSESSVTPQSGSGLHFTPATAPEETVDESPRSDSSSPSAEGTTESSANSVIEVLGLRVPSSSSSETPTERSSRSESSVAERTVESTSPSVIEMPGHRLPSSSSSEFSGSGEKRGSDSSSRSENVPNVHVVAAGGSPQPPEMRGDDTSDSSGSEGKTEEEKPNVPAVKKKVPGGPQDPSTSGGKKASGSSGKAEEEQDAKEPRTDSPMDTGSDPESSQRTVSPSELDAAAGSSSGVTSGRQTTVESSKSSRSGDTNRGSSDTEESASGSTETSGGSERSGTGSSSKKTSSSSKHDSSGSSKMDYSPRSASTATTRTTSGSKMDFSPGLSCSASAMDTASDGGGYSADLSSTRSVTEDTDSPPSSAGLLPRDPSPLPRGPPPKPPKRAGPPTPPTPDYPPSPGFSLNPPSRLPVVEDVPEEGAADVTDDSSA